MIACRRITATWTHGERELLVDVAISGYGDERECEAIGVRTDELASVDVPDLLDVANGSFEMWRALEADDEAARDTDSEAADMWREERKDNRLTGEPQ